MRRRRAGSYLIAALGVLGLLGWPACRRSAAPSPPDSTLAVGLALASPVHAVGWLAQEKGFFAASGLTATVQVLGGSAATVQALLGGRLELALAGGDAALKANAAGGDLVVLAGLIHRHIHRLVARPEISGPGDLRGKRIGLPFTGGPQDMAVHYALGRYGLRYGVEVEILSLGKDFNLMVALERNTIQAATSQLPPARLQSLGLKVLMDLAKEPVAFPYLMVLTTRSALQSRPGALKAGLKALCAAIRYYRAPENLDESVRLIAPHLGLTAPEAAEQVQDLGPSRFSWPPVPETSALASLASDAGAVTRLVELTPLRQLQAEGHCG